MSLLRRYYKTMINEVAEIIYSQGRLFKATLSLARSALL